MGVCLPAETVRTTEPVPPAVRTTLLELRLATGPWRTLGVRLDDRVTVPENPPKLVSVTVEVPEELRWMLRLVGFAVIEKSGVVPELLKIAVCTVSGSGVGVPLAIVTQVLETLVLEHPTWKPRGVLEVDPVMLYMAVKRRPVVGELVIVPGAESAAK